MAGPALIEVFRSCGFQLNDRKFRVFSRYDRQLVTGLVVNDVPRMPRKWRRELRTLLHLRRKLGEDEASNVAVAFRRKRPSSTEAKISSVIKGRVAFASHMDARFGTKYVESIIRAFPGQHELFERNVPTLDVTVITEGKTDRWYLEKAFEVISAKYKPYSRIKLNFSDKPVLEAGFGDEALKRHIQEISAHTLPTITIGLFDCDNDKILREFDLGPGKLKILTRTLAVACLPNPGVADSAFCIEHFIPAEIRSRKNADGRRLFDIADFDPVNGSHRTEAVYRTNPRKSTLIVDSEVFSKEDGRSVAISKADFCAQICREDEPYTDFDWGTFKPVFDLLIDGALSAARGFK